LCIFNGWNMLRLLLFVLPLGFDTLGISISLGIKSRLSEASSDGKSKIPSWLASALLFSAAETLMPLVGLAVGYAVSLVISDIMHFAGPLLLIAVGLWELQEEIRERIRMRKKSIGATLTDAVDGFSTQKQDYLPPKEDAHERRPDWFPWGRQLLLALSVSLDELAIGFSLGAVSLSLPRGMAISPITLCIVIGLQSFLMTLIGLTLGRALRAQLKPVKEWLELISGFLLIGLGIWLFLT
jgi:putative Mn2+ efflux pump MntP